MNVSPWSVQMMKHLPAPSMVIITSCFTEALEDLEILDLLTEYLEPPKIGDQFILSKAFSSANVEPRCDLLNEALADLQMEGLGEILKDDLGDLPGN